MGEEQPQEIPSERIFDDKGFKFDRLDDQAQQMTRDIQEQTGVVGKDEPRMPKLMDVATPHHPTAAEQRLEHAQPIADNFAQVATEGEAERQTQASGYLSDDRMLELLRPTQAERDMGTRSPNHSDEVHNPRTDRSNTLRRDLN